MLAIFDPQSGLKSQPRGTPEARDLLHPVVDHVCQPDEIIINGCALIEGCTELSGILKSHPRKHLLVIDPLEIVAEVALERAGVEVPQDGLNQ